MRLLRQVPAALASLLLVPSVAQAHLVTTGLGPFYDGAMHVALSPDDWLGLLAAALLAGLCGAQAGRWTLVVLPLAWLVGAIVGLGWGVELELPGLSILSFVALGLLVALDAKLPSWSVAALGGIFGLLHGVLNGTSLAQVDGGLLNILGIVTTVFVVLLLTFS